MTVSMKVSDYIALFLERNNVRQVYELIGGMITHLLDALHRRARIRIVSMHHEQAAGFAAEGSARMTGTPGVALATSGPGAVNLLTAIGSCYFDSVPAVFITGQVNRHELRGDRPVRQAGFQETDIVSMAGPITKAAWLALKPDELPGLLSHAFQLALCGRPGPVLIDIPMDVQRACIQVPRNPPSVRHLTTQPDLSDSGEMFEDLLRAERPLILAGGGIRSACAVEPFRKLVNRLEIPVIHSLMGVDLLPYGHALRVGMIGTYGNRWANYALFRADFLLVLGSRLDIRQTGADIRSFEDGKKIWHIDIEPGEIKNSLKNSRWILAELGAFLRSTPIQSASCPDERFKTWQDEITALRLKWPDTAEQPDLPGIDPNSLMHRLSRCFPQASAFVVDVGQHQMWAAQSLELTAEQRFLTSGGMGSMGFALPAGIGVAISSPGQPVVVIAGDGGFQCNIQELETLAHLGLPLKIIIINNKSLGMVRQFQEDYFESRLQSTVIGYSAPDFSRVAEAYGIPGRCVKRSDRIDAELGWLYSTGNGPGLLDVRIDLEAKAYPKTAFGKPIHEMEPHKDN